MLKQKLIARCRLLPALLLVLVFCAGAPAAIVPVTKFKPADLAGKTPEGWALEQKVGTPSVKMEKDGEMYYLRLQSQGNSSFGLRTSVRVDVKEFPILSWRWKVNKLPAAGDVRKQASDDQALQVYIAFKETGFPALLNTPVIGYIWDNEAPKGWSGRSAQVGGDKMRYIVLRNKTDKTGQWYTERRNVYEDYRKLFGDINGGEPMGVTTGMQVHINTQRTRSFADGMIGDIYFSSETGDIAATQAAKEQIVARKPVISAPRRKSLPVAPVVNEPGKTGCLNIRIPFETNSSGVDSLDDRQVQAIMEYLVKYPQARLMITGHTDNTGTEDYNMILSRRRAENVQKLLTEKYNIGAQNLLIRGVGPAEPVADNGTPEGQAQNRRVMIQNCPE